MRVVLASIYLLLTIAGHAQEINKTAVALDSFPPFVKTVKMTEYVPSFKSNGDTLLKERA